MAKASDRYDGDAPAFRGAGNGVTGNTGRADIQKEPRTPRGGVPTVGGAGTDVSGNAALTVCYDAWGTPQVSSFIPHPSSFQFRYLFQGREYSYATGLYNFRARWYDPVVGRWLSNDPIGISGGLNLYAFCGNDPVNYVDPWGFDAYEVDWTAHPGWVHVDRYANTHGSHGKRGSYQLSGTPVKDAPPLPKRDLPAFRAAAKRGLRYALKTGAKFAGIALALYTPDSLADGELPEELRIKPILILPENPYDDKNKK